MSRDRQHSDVSGTSSERDDEWWAHHAVEVVQVIQQHFCIEAVRVESCTGTEAPSGTSPNGGEIPSSLLEMTRAACVHPGARVTLATAPSLVSHLSSIVSASSDVADLETRSAAAATMLQCILYCLYQTGRHENNVLLQVEYLCSVLVERISMHGSATGGMPFLELLATLCREDYRARAAVKRSASAKKFYRHLVSLLDGDNLCAVVHSLSLLTSLLINENLGQKLFNPQNIDQTLQMAINLMQDAFPAAVSSPSQSYGRSVSGLLKALQRRAPVRRSLEATWLFLHSIDLMIDIVSNSSDVARQTLQHSEHVPRAIVFAMDSTVHRQCSYSMRSKLAQLLWAFCWSMIQFALQTLAPGPSTTPTHTDDVSAHAAVGVVGALLSHIARTPATAATAGKVVVATFTDFLARVESTVSAYTATRSTDAADSCAVAPLLALLALVLEGGASLWKRGQFVHLTDKLSTLLVAAVSTAPRSPPHAHTMITLASWRLLSVLRQTDMHATFAACSTIDRRGVAVEIIAHGLASSAFANVALALLASDALTATSSPDARALHAQRIAASATFAFTNAMSTAAHGARAQQDTSASTTQQGFSQIAALGRHTSRRGADHASEHNSSHSPRRSENACVTRSSGGDSAGAGGEATAVVARLMQGLRLKDLKSSELLNIYESKFRDMEAREGQLHALLDSKSNSLAQADSLVSEFRSKQVGMNKEFEVLRAHLQTAEVKSEASCAELLTVQGLHRQVTERCATLETQIQRMKESLASKETHNAHVMEQLALERHARESTEHEYESVATRCQALEVENETLNDRCTATTALCVDLRSSVQELSATVSQRDTDFQALNEQYEAVCAKCAWIEDEKIQVEEHCQELEQAGQQKQKDLDSLQQKYAELQDYVKRQAQLLSAIQNLSMNAPPQ